MIAAALKVNPGSPDAASNCGLVLHSLERHEEALKLFDHALELNRAHANVLNNRGLTLAALGRTAEALASWGSALEVDPNHCESLHSRGNALYKLKCLDAALADYERVLALQPDKIDVLNNRGGVLVELGRLDAALDSYERALVLAPERPELLINKGNVLADQHEFELALTSYGQAAAVGTMPLRRNGAKAWFGFDWDNSRTAGEASVAMAAGRLGVAAARFRPPLWLRKSRSQAGRFCCTRSRICDTLQLFAAKLVTPSTPSSCSKSSRPKVSALERGCVAGTYARGETLPAFDVHRPLELPLAFGAARIHSGRSSHSMRRPTDAPAGVIA